MLGIHMEVLYCQLKMHLEGVGVGLGGHDADPGQSVPGSRRFRLLKKLGLHARAGRQAP